ncbi:MAG: zinc-ribbon domain containing protein [Phycisphaerales bacterium]
MATHPKSGKQHAQDMKRRRDARRLKAQLRRESPRQPVNIEALAPDGSYGRPDFVERGQYADIPFTCVDCGAGQVWTPTQQKWYFEVAKGSVWNKPKRCRKCRIIERNRRDEARRMHADNAAAKKAKTRRK